MGSVSSFNRGISMAAMKQDPEYLPDNIPHDSKAMADVDWRSLLSLHGARRTGEDQPTNPSKVAQGLVLKKEKGTCWNEM